MGNPPELPTLTCQSLQDNQTELQVFYALCFIKVFYKSVLHTFIFV